MTHLWRAVDKGEQNIALRHIGGAVIEGNVVDRDEFGVVIQPDGSTRHHLFPWTSVVSITFEATARARAPRQATIL